MTAVPAPTRSWTPEFSPTPERSLRDAQILMVTLKELRRSAQLSQLAGAACARVNTTLGKLAERTMHPDHLKPLPRKEREKAQVEWTRQTLWGLRHAARRLGPAGRTELLDLLSGQPLSPGRMIVECALRGGRAWARDDWNAACAMRGDRRLLTALSGHLGALRDDPRPADPAAHNQALGHLRESGYEESAERLAASGLQLRCEETPGGARLLLGTDIESGPVSLSVEAEQCDQLDELLTGMSIPCCIQHSLDGELRRPVDGGRWASERHDDLFETRKLLYRALSSARRGLIGQAPQSGPNVRRALWNWLEGQAIG